MDRSLEQKIEQFSQVEKYTDEYYEGIGELSVVFDQLAQRVMKRFKDEKWVGEAVVCCFKNLKNFDGKSKAINFFTVCIIKEWHKSRRHNG